MYCPNCGKPDVSTSFCPKCGGAIPEAQAAPPGVAPQQETSSWYTHEESAYDQNVQRQAQAEQTAGTPVSRVFEFDPSGESTFFGKIKLMLKEPDRFFANTNLEAQVFAGLLIIFLVNLLLGGGMIFKDVFLRLLTKPTDFDTKLKVSALFLMFPFCITFLSVTALSAAEKELADWKRIFVIYSFACVPFVIAAIPLPYLRLVGLGAFMYFSVIGFEQAFGLERIKAVLFSVGPPLLFLAIAALASGRYCLLAFIK